MEPEEEPEEYVQEETIGDILKQLTPFVEKFAPQYIEYQKTIAPQIKRYQYIHFTIMMTILLSVALLAFFKTIDGSAATGLIGAVIGYVFGNIRTQSRTERSSGAGHGGKAKFNKLMMQSDLR